MHKLVILVEMPADRMAFEEEWPKFLHLAERMPGLVRETSCHIENILYGNFNYSFIHELYFEDAQATIQAMSSPEGRQAGKQLQLMTNGKVVLFMADHREDDLAHINQYRVQENDQTRQADSG
jgi:uncharacterized protein (TIGR02118 family)